MADDARFLPIEEFPDDQPSPPPPEGDYSEAPKPKFLLEHISSISFNPAAAHYAIKGLLPTGGLATCYGPPKSYKSFIMMDAALSIARGLPWAGRKVMGGAVVYVACEGAMGARLRMLAYRKHHEIAAADFPFYFVDARPNLGVQGGDTADLVAAVESVTTARGIKPALLVIDTLARSLGGQDENAAGMVSFVTNAEDLSKRFKCLTVAVHHTPHGGDRMRGHSSLLGSVVASWKVEKVDKMKARVTLEDAKDLESGVAWEIDLLRTEIDVDEDGDEIASLVVSGITEPGDATPKGKTSSGQKISPSMKAFMQAFENALGSNGQRVRPFADGPEVHAVAVEDVRHAYYALRKDEETPEAKRQAFKRAKGSLVSSQVLCVEENRTMGPFFWRP